MDELSVIAENLAEADRMLWDSWILRTAHLSDLSYHLQKQLTRRLADGEEIEQILASVYGEFAERFTDQPFSQNEGLVRLIDLFTRVELCKSLSARSTERRIPLWNSPDPVIAYFQNPFAGRVLRSVTHALGGGEAYAAEDYSAACEGVADGRFDFCVLPVESARDGVMSRFVQLIDRYDLFTVLTCHLELDEDEYIRFALLAAAPCALPTADRLQLRLVTKEDQLWELLFAANHLGAALIGCRMLPTENAATYQITLRTGVEGISALTYYLGMAASRSTFTGFYAQLNLPAESEQALLD